MSAATDKATLDALEYAMKLNQDSAGLREAKERLAALRQLHPEAKLALAWETVAYDQSLHYDVLLGLAGGTLSLSFCPDRPLPWPMRAMHRWSEMELARVNSATLRVEDAIGCLDFIWSERRIIDRLVNTCLIQEALEDEPIHLSNEELQLAMDGFRRAHKLYKAEETRRWMERQGVTHESLERLVSDQAKAVKLRDRVAAGQVAAYFEAHRSDFDSARIAKFEVTDRDKANLLFSQIRLGAVDFYEAAENSFLSAEGRAAEGHWGEIFAVVRRGPSPAAFEEAIFTARPGDLVGPTPRDNRFSIVRVLSLEPARLGQRNIEAIKGILFEEWLEERRNQASIEWFWGNAH